MAASPPKHSITFAISSETVWRIFASRTTTTITTAPPSHSVASVWPASARPSGLNSQLSCDDLFAKPLSHRVGSEKEMMPREIDSSRTLSLTLSTVALSLSLFSFLLSSPSAAVCCGDADADVDGHGDAFSRWAPQLVAHTVTAPSNDIPARPFLVLLMLVLLFDCPLELPVPLVHFIFFFFFFLCTCSATPCAQSGSEH